LGGAALEGVAETFEQYMSMLIKALPGQEVEEEGKRKVSLGSFVYQNALQFCIFTKCFTEFTNCSHFFINGIRLLQVQMAASEDQQLSLLGNAAALADELVAVVASKLLPGGSQVVAGESRAPRPSTLAARSPELKDLRRQLQMHVETLKFHLCNGIIIGLCYDDYGSKLNATTYFQIDSEMPRWRDNPQPTTLFQVCLRSFSLNHLGASR
jgi:hypothetical protein